MLLTLKHKPNTIRSSPGNHAYVIYLKYTEKYTFYFLKIWQHGSSSLNKPREMNQLLAYLIAAVLVEQYQYERHHHYHADHDGGVEDGIDSTLAHSVGVFTEGSVDAR